MCGKRAGGGRAEAMPTRKAFTRQEKVRRMVAANLQGRGCRQAACHGQGSEALVVGRVGGVGDGGVRSGRHHGQAGCGPPECRGGAAP